MNVTYDQFISAQLSIPIQIQSLEGLKQLGLLILAGKVVGPDIALLIIFLLEDFGRDVIWLKFIIEKKRANTYSSKLLVHFLRTVENSRGSEINDFDEGTILV